jgi:TonB family protein
MRDGVADVLAQRRRLDRGAGSGLLISVLLHGGLTAALVYAAMHATKPERVGLVNIQFAPMPSAAAPASAPATAKPKPAAPKPPEPKIEEPKPKIDEPKAIVPEPPKAPEKNTVPLSPFGRSTKKGSETPAATPPAPATPAPAAPGVPGTTTDVPIGGSGITGIEGGDFPYTLYIQGMHRRIGTNWFRPQVAAGTSTIIYFRILKNGTIAEAKVQTPSGNGTFDRAALSAVRSSSPLNPLPFGYNGDYLGVHLTFR